jgi:hypothetical protein
MREKGFKSVLEDLGSVPGGPEVFWWSPEVFSKYQKVLKYVGSF